MTQRWRRRGPAGLNPASSQWLPAVFSAPQTRGCPRDTLTSHDADGNPTLVTGRQRDDNDPATGGSSEGDLTGPASATTASRDSYVATWYDLAGRPTDSAVLSATWTPQSDLFNTQVGLQGMWLDAASGLYHTLNRDYCSALGRWLEQDPSGYGDGSSLYQAFDGSPVGLADPAGLDPATNQAATAPSGITGGRYHGAVTHTDGWTAVPEVLFSPSLVNDYAIGHVVITKAVSGGGKVIYKTVSTVDEWGDIDQATDRPDGLWSDDLNEPMNKFAKLHPDPRCDTVELLVEGEVSVFKDLKLTFVRADGTTVTRSPIRRPVDDFGGGMQIVSNVGIKEDGTAIDLGGTHAPVGADLKYKSIAGVGKPILTFAYQYYWVGSDRGGMLTPKSGFIKWTLPGNEGAANSMAKKFPDDR